MKDYILYEYIFKSVEMTKDFRHSGQEARS